MVTFWFTGWSVNWFNYLEDFEVIGVTLENQYIFSNVEDADIIRFTGFAAGCVLQMKGLNRTSTTPQGAFLLTVVMEVS
jgi:hypothetical protein